MFEEMCCRPIVDGRKQAQTALALMRSRYSAFFWGDAAHLNRTQLNGRVEDDEPLFKVQWLGLTILSVEKGRAEDHEGRVEFAADFHQNQRVLKNSPPRLQSR